MRRPVLFLLILLVCLRGWMGSAMAGEMVAMQLASAQPATAVATTEHADCHGNAAQPPADSAPATPHALGCASCLQCQACSTVALLPVLPAFAQAGPAATFRAQAERFASATPAPGFKPPIA